MQRLNFKLSNLKLINIIAWDLKGFQRKETFANKCEISHFFTKMNFAKRKENDAEFCEKKNKYGTISHFTFFPAKQINAKTFAFFSKGIPNFLQNTKVLHKCDIFAKRLFQWAGNPRTNQ